MILSRCPCGYEIEDEEVSPEHPAKNRIGADLEQSNNQQGAEMSDNQTTHQFTTVEAEVDRLRTVRASVVDSRNRLVKVFNDRQSESAEALAYDEGRLELMKQISDQATLIDSYDREIAKVQRSRDFAALKAKGWIEEPTYEHPESTDLIGPDAEDDAGTISASLMWADPIGTHISIDTPRGGGICTLAQAHQFALRLLIETTKVMHHLEPTQFSIDSLNEQQWQTVEPMQPAFPDDVTTFERTAELPHHGRVSVLLDPDDGRQSIGHADMVKLDEIPGVDGLEQVALAVLEFAADCRRH